MKVNVFYNYYTQEDEARQKEIDFCFNRLVSNPNIDKIYVQLSGHDFDHGTEDIAENMHDPKIKYIISGERPTFKYVVYDVLGVQTEEDDINILLNSDCFFSKNTDWDLIKSMSHMERFCLSRFDIKKDVFGEMVINKKTGFPRVDSQDCWIFKGYPNDGMDIDFCFGMPGCDNRMSYEMGINGFSVSGPVSKIHVLHYHDTNLRTYDADRDRINGQYRLIPLT